MPGSDFSSPVRSGFLFLILTNLVEVGERGFSDVRKRLQWALIKKNSLGCSSMDSGLFFRFNDFCKSL